MGARAKRVTIAALLAIVLAAAITLPARAAESLDPSFGEGGISFPGLGGDIRGLAQDSEGRLISGGTASGDYFRIARYLSDGALDLSLGEGDGHVESFLGLGSRANAVAVQRDGKILAAGSTDAGTFVLARYEEDGSRRDPRFGDDGQARTIAGHRGGGAQDVEIQPSGRILAAGYGIDNHYRWSAMVTAYRPDGAPDASFGSDGIVRLRPKGKLPIELVSVETLPGGRILAAGALSGYIMVLALRPDGRADTRFGGGDGLVLTDVDGARRCVCEYASDMEIDRRGRIVVAANVIVPRQREPAVLIRYRPNGSLDRGFGKGGIARAVLGSRLAGKDIAIQHDGRIVQAGTYNVPRSGEARLAVVRFLPDGRLDRGFARRGFFIRDFGVESVAYAALTQRDGRVVIGGRANPEPSPFPEDPSVYDTAEVFLIRFLP